MTAVIGPGSTIGILGAGQLGRMLAVSARTMGYRVCVFGGDRTSPAGQLSDQCWPGDYADADSLDAFASACDVVTYEFENIPAKAADFIAERTLLRPGAALLKAAQNRFLEKSALQAAGLQTAEFRMVQSAEELQNACKDFGGYAIVKANTQGYDGKGQWPVSPDTDLRVLWESICDHEIIVEKRVDFDFELSVIGGRSADGCVQLYPPFLNHHKNHILDVTVSGSAMITAAIDSEARTMAAAVLEHFDVVGVLCLELFLTADGCLLVNEIAPRPHNSGHLTIEAFRLSQFDLQLRTICGLPIGSLERTYPAAVMANLLGQHLPAQWDTATYRVIHDGDAFLHLYGKGEARENRKVGHLTFVGQAGPELEASARQVRRALGR